MDKEEFKAKVGKIDSEQIIYEVCCNDCITYIDTPSMTAIISGRIDGKESQEFYKLGEAEAAIRLHKDSYPLHKPRILPRIIEYLIHSSKYMIRYRAVNGYVHVHSVNGFFIPSDKCAFACRRCDAIYKSKSLYGHSFFPTFNPKCKAEVHSLYESREGQYPEYNIVKICVCPDLDERIQIKEEKLHEDWCKANPEKATKCHICGATPKSDHPENVGWNGSTKDWIRAIWSGDIDGVYEEKLVCVDCYYTGSEYKTRCGPIARRRYLLAKKRRLKMSK